jgi:serine/threonine-protein phosphatase 2A regulatory subunit B''
MHVDEEIDINKVHEYFSYEHFYVLYCRFFELDIDKDLKLTREDLLKFGNHCLSEAIVDRIFQVAPRASSVVARQLGNTRSSNTISYPDFIYFFLSEEDKTSDAGLRYWFSCLDLDGDGFVSPEDMKYFYRAQLHRITSLGQESVNFSDVMCQMMDMIAPQDDQALQLRDFTRPTKKAVSGVLFDILFNLNKFVRFESRDPFQEKAKRDDAFDCDWDRFANFEYHRLAAEEEGFVEVLYK